MMVQAFEGLRNALCDMALLTIHVPEDAFLLQCDASGNGVGGVLSVVRDGQILPVSFFSRQLKAHQHNYSAMELEMLALVSSVEYFAMYLYGRSFVVETDHKSLLAIPTSNRLSKHLRGLWL